MNALLTTLCDAFAGLIFPSTCVICATPIESLADGVACAPCWQQTPLAVPEPRCYQCGLPIRGQLPADPQRRCTRCRDAAFTLLRFAGPYNGALRANLLFLKDHPHVCQRMRDLVIAAFEKETALHTVDIVMPIPLHLQRLRERGFNQATLIARLISRRAKIPLKTRWLIRTKHTERHRAGMDAKARATSVEAAFAVRRPERIKDQIVLLVDDVFTTGATLNECGRTLMEAGAKAVYGFTVARVLS
jgi:ComF family protein